MQLTTTGLTMARNNKAATASKTERVQRAFELRKAGKSLRQISELLGYSHEMVRKDINSVIQSIVTETKDLATDMITLELARLNDLQFAVWPDARKGDRKCIDTMLRIMERRAKLLGLDTPVTTKAVNVTLTHAELQAMSDEELQRMIEQFKG